MLLHIESCDLSAIHLQIRVECTYPVNSLVTGFQMIAHSSQVYKLHVAQTVDRQATASVEVEENGVYWVTVFAIREEMGIVSSNVEYAAQIEVPVVNDKETTIPQSNLDVTDETCNVGNV